MGGGSIFFPPHSVFAFQIFHGIFNFAHGGVKLTQNLKVNLSGLQNVFRLLNTDVFSFNSGAPRVAGNKLLTPLIACFFYQKAHSLFALTCTELDIF